MGFVVDHVLNNIKEVLRPINGQRAEQRVHVPAAAGVRSGKVSSIPALMAMFLADPCTRARTYFTLLVDPTRLSHVSRWR